MRIIIFYILYIFVIFEFFSINPYLHAQDQEAYGFDIPVQRFKNNENNNKDNLKEENNIEGAYGFDIPSYLNKKLSKIQIREKGFDGFGNPKDDIYGLGEVDNELLRGEKILLYIAYNGEDDPPGQKKYEWHHAKNSVAERHIHMDIEYAPSRDRCSLTKNKLYQYSQLWFVTDKNRSLNDKQITLIEQYVKNGNGLLIWADNEPYYADANLMAERIIGTKFSGSLMGDQIMQAGNSLKPGYFIEHPLTQGVNKLYEGITISTISPAPNLKILAQSHDGQMCMACFEKGNQRVVLDTGFTKLHSGRFHNTAGTARYFRNIAFWLSKSGRNFQYTLLTPGRRNTAIIKKGESSEKYRFKVTRPVEITTMLFWSGKAKLALMMKNPNGKIVHNRIYSNNEVRINVDGNINGDWECWVKGIEVAKSEQEYVLILRMENN